MKKSILLLTSFIVLNVCAQVKIGDNPATIDASALLEMESTDKGLLTPRMTTAQRTSITSPALGLIVFDTDLDRFMVNKASGSHDWEDILDSEAINKRFLVKNLGGTVGNYTEFATLVRTHGAHNVRMSITSSNSGYSVSKTYDIGIKYNQTGTAWQVVNPISSTGPYSGRDFELDIRVNTTTATFRLRNSAGTTAGNHTISFASEGLTDDVFTELSATGTTTAPTTIFSSTPLRVEEGNVGINVTKSEGTLDIDNSIDAQVNWSGNLLPYGTEKADLILTRKLSSVKDAGLGYANNIIDFRSVNASGHNWSVAQISTSVDPNGGSGWQGGLNFHTSSGGSVDPAGRRNRGSAPEVRMSIDANGNIGIGTSAPESILDITSTTAALIPPRMTTAQKNAIATPIEGSVLYDNDLDCLSLYTDANWECIETRDLKSGIIGKMYYEFNTGTNWFDTFFNAQGDDEPETPAEVIICDDNLDGFTLGFDAIPADDFIFQFIGYLYVPASGTWLFQTRSDDGSRIYIDDVLIVNNDRDQGPTTRAGSVNLTKGFHKFVCLYRERGGGIEFYANWSNTAAGFALKRIGSEYLFFDTDE